MLMPFFHLNTQDSIQKYMGTKMSDMPPHVYATAEAALRYLKNEQKNQSCIISGESGAGKVNNITHSLDLAIYFFEDIFADYALFKPY